MATKLFVAGLAYSMTEDELRSLFAEFGTVDSAQIITDRATNQSKGFGFVELSSDEESQKAIAALNGKEMNGRPLTVNIAKPREDRPRPSYQDRGGDRGGDRRNTMGNNFRQSRR